MPQGDVCELEVGLLQGDEACPHYCLAREWFLWPALLLRDQHHSENRLLSELSFNLDVSHRLLSWTLCCSGIRTHCLHLALVQSQQASSTLTQTTLHTCSVVSNLAP